MCSSDLPDGRVRVEVRRIRETNSFTEPFIKRGPVWSYSAKAVVGVGIVVASHELRKSDKKLFRVIGYILPVIASGYQSHLTIRNLGLGREL